MSLFLGIDGGGTRSTLLAMDETGAPLARVEGGPAIVDPANPAARAEPLAQLVFAALERVGAEPPADVLCCALAGVGRPAERAALAAALVVRGVARQLHVIADAEAALHDAFGTGQGVLVISGTGSVVWGRSADGRTLRVGGWGQLLGDEGSGYAIGLAGARAVLRSYDGRAEATALTGAVLEKLGLAIPDDLVRWMATATKRDVAALAPVVLCHAQDPAAALIIETAAAELADQVATVVRLLEPWQGRVPLALNGGLIAPGRGFRDAVLRVLARGPAAFAVHQDPVDAARGAALIARARHLA